MSSLPKKTEDQFIQDNKRAEVLDASCASDSASKVHLWESHISETKLKCWDKKLTCVERLSGQGTLEQTGHS